MSSTHPSQAILAVAPELGADPPQPDRIAVPGTAPRVDEAPRPHRNLLRYYALHSLLLGPFFWILLIPRYFRYRTLRYAFDEEGVTMRWGLLVRREISLTYARIQDIHLTSNVVERWLGLAKIQVQTASGSAGAEMTIEGLLEFEQVRDFLYSRMRGRRESAYQPAKPTALEAATAGSAALTPAAVEELTSTLRAVTEELRGLRASLPPKQSADREVPRG